jgi:hypothetical protein
MKIIKVNFDNPIPDNFTGIAEWGNGEKQWYKEGNLHREDGPAIESPDGKKSWHKEGKHHRLDGPAFEHPNGTKYWIIENKQYFEEELLNLISSSLFLGKEKGRYDLEWLRFLAEEGIKEFPIMPGMKEYKGFKQVFETLEGMENK